MFNHFDTCFSHTFQILWILKDNRVICTSIASGSPELWRFAHVRNGKQKTETVFVCLLSLGTSWCNWQSLKDSAFCCFFCWFKELPKLTKLSNACLHHPPSPWNLQMYFRLSYWDCIDCICHFLSFCLCSMSCQILHCTCNTCINPEPCRPCTICMLHLLHLYSWNFLRSRDLVWDVCPAVQLRGNLPT